MFATFHCPGTIKGRTFIIRLPGIWAKRLFLNHSLSTALPNFKPNQF